MTVVLENVRSSWNVGSIFRTCDALGFDLILVGYTSKPLEKNLRLIHKTALGAENTVKWQHFEHSQEVFVNFADYLHLAIEISPRSQSLFSFLKEIKNKDLSDSKKFVVNKKTLLWFGNEIHGLSPQTLKQSNFELHLNMIGQKESLNIATCVSAVGYIFRFWESMDNDLN